MAKKGEKKAAVDETERLKRESAARQENERGESLIKSDVISDYRRALRFSLENQVRLLENIMSTSRQLIKSETALNLYREEVLSATKKRLGQENFGITKFAWDPEDGWYDPIEDVKAMTELFAAAR